MTDAAPIHLYSLGVPCPGVTRRIDWTWGMISTPHSRFQVLGFHSRASPGPRLPISQVQVALGGGEALPPHVFVHLAPRVLEPLPVPALCRTGGKATSRARVCLRGGRGASASRRTGCGVMRGALLHSHTWEQRRGRPAGPPRGAGFSTGSRRPSRLPFRTSPEPAGTVQRHHRYHRVPELARQRPN